MNTLSQSVNHRNYWDKTGVGTSLLCVLHCLATPLLITILPALAATEHQTHKAFATVILLVGLLAFLPGYRQHRKRSIPVAGAIGVTAILAATLLPETQSGEILETLMVVTGGLTLITAHLRNAYWCRFCRVCGDNSCALQRDGNTPRLPAD